MNLVLQKPALRPLRPGLLTAGIIGIVLVLSAGAYFRFGSADPLAIDRWWFSLIQAPTGSFAHSVAVLLAHIGGSIGTVLCAAALAVLLFLMRKRREAITLWLALLIGIAGSESIKRLVLRPRPWDQFFTSDGTSFPSGHSMGAAVLAVTLACIVAYSVPRHSVWRPIAWVLATLWIAAMMWSRTALHVHWLTDTAGGVLLGTSASLIAVSLVLGVQKHPAHASS